MAKRILIVDENVGQETPRKPRSDELTEILDVVLAQLIRGNQGKRDLVEFLEERLIQVALKEASNNKTRASKSLGIERKRLERRVKKYQLVGGTTNPAQLKTN